MLLLRVKSIVLSINIFLLLYFTVYALLAHKLISFQNFNYNVTSDCIYYIFTLHYVKLIDRYEKGKFLINFKIKDQSLNEIEDIFNLN